MIDNVIFGLSQIADVRVILVIALGVAIGVVFGALPGLTATMAVALIAPLTFDLTPLIALPFLVGVYRGGLHGGVITSIMIGVPGTPANVPTIIDGYAMAKRGYPQSALRYALFSSVAGALIASVLLFTLITPASRLALAFGSPEIFALILFSMTLVTYISGANLAKGLLAAGAGMFIGSIGLDPVVGTPRFTFGVTGLTAGIPIIAMFIGLFALPELMSFVEQRVREKTGKTAETDEAVRATFSAPDDNILLRDVLRLYWRRILASAGIGSFIGVLPGIGSETSPWLSYAAAKRGKNGENLGNGDPEGVVASEVANDAVVGAAFVPTLAFGIPGDLPLAVMLGAIMAQGIRPGPALVRDNPEVLFGIVASVFASSILLYLIVRPLTKYVKLLVEIPTSALTPIILGLCVAGAFGVNNRPFDLWVMVFFGLVGYAMRKSGVPLAPMVLAFVLSKSFETAFRESMMLERNFSVFTSSPSAMTMIALSIIVIVSSVIVDSRRRAKDAEASTAAAE